MQSDKEKELEKKRDFGVQPIARIMAENNLVAHDLVEAAQGQLTHKMVARAAKGRWLTRNVKTKILDAVNAATAQSYTLEDIFNYR